MGVSVHAGEPPSTLFPPRNGAAASADVPGPLRRRLCQATDLMRVVWAALLKRYELQWRVCRPNLPTRC
jgi:hypothetical protein